MHAAARKALDGLSGARLVTSDYVLDEALTRWLTTGRARPGLAFVQAVLRSPRYEVVFVSRDVFDRTLARAAKLAGHGLSFTDCTSVVLVTDMRLDAIFSFDSGFARVGLSVIPDG